MPEVADILLLQQSLRLCDSLTKVGYLLVNDASKITPFDTAVCWLKKGNKIEAVSGLPEPVSNTPFTDWMGGLCQQFAADGGRNPRKLDLKALAAEDQSRWQEYLSAEAVWIPLTTAKDVIGGLLYVRQADWRDEELGILGYWGLAAGHAVDALQNRNSVEHQPWRKLLNRRVLLIAVAAVLLLLLIPVDLVVTSTAEVVPKEPEVVRAPIEGIIGEVHVLPNQEVRAGDLVLSFDDTPIRAQLDVVQQEFAIANAEYQRANQAAVSDRRVAAELPMLKARVEQKSAQVRFNQTMLERARIYADADAIAILPDVQELEGRPVKTGEKILTLAKPGNVELEFWLAVGDSIPLPDRAEADLFLNVHPDQVHQAHVRYISYQAEVSPDGILGFRGRADFVDPTGLRVGWRGTARVHGEPVALGYYIFRRPLSVLRQWTGF